MEVRMSKLGSEIIAGLHDALEYAKGQSKGNKEHRVVVPEYVDVRHVRHRLNMTQKEFAQSFGFSVYSIRNWEQGKRQPEGSARALLTVIDKEPEAVRRALVL